MTIGKENLVLDKFYLPRQLVEAATEVAARRGVSRSEFMRSVLWEAVTKDALMRKDIEVA